MRQFLAACAALALVPVSRQSSGRCSRVEKSGAAYVALTRAGVRAGQCRPGVRTRGHRDRRRSSVEVDDFALEAPYRVVIDLKGATLGMAPRYDRVAAGGVTNVRAAQFKPNVVRVVIEIDAAHSYEVFARMAKSALSLPAARRSSQPGIRRPDACKSSGVGKGTCSSAPRLRKVSYDCRQQPGG